MSLPLFIYITIISFSVRHVCGFQSIHGKHNLATEHERELYRGIYKLTGFIRQG